jgi:arsenate reductase
MSITIYHNPKCSNSRTALALIRESGVEPTIIEYLNNPPTRKQLAELVAAIGTGARGLLRSKEALCKELGLDDPAVSDAKLFDAMAAHPILINRPVVVTPKGAKLCRPPELVRELLG